MKTKNNLSNMKIATAINKHPKNIPQLYMCETIPKQWLMLLTQLELISF